MNRVRTKTRAPGPTAKNPGRIDKALGVALALALFTGTGLGQTRGPVVPRGKPIELIVEARVDSDAWATRLANTDLDAREIAFDELVARSRRDASFSLALKAWSMDSARPELAWNARLVLRELARRARPSKIAWVPLGAGFAEPLQGVTGQDAGPSGDAEHWNSEALRDFQLGGEFPLADLSRLSLSSRRMFWIPTESRAVPSHRTRFRLDFQPEGVVLVVTELDHGRSSERTYAARSIEQLLKTHPELRGKVPALASIKSRQLAAGPSGRRLAKSAESGVFQFRGGRNGSPSSSVQVLSSNGQLWAQSEPAGAEILLGVKCTTLPTSEAERRLLGPGVGLLIEGREPGSIAEFLELQRGDILVELFGQQLCSVEEISRLLGERKSARITVKIVDRDGIERVRTWTPAGTNPK